MTILGPTKLRWSESQLLDIYPLGMTNIAMDFFWGNSHYFYGNFQELSEITVGYLFGAGNRFGITVDNKAQFTQKCAGIQLWVTSVHLQCSMSFSLFLWICTKLMQNTDRRFGNSVRSSNRLPIVHREFEDPKFAPLLLPLPPNSPPDATNHKNGTTPKISKLPEKSPVSKTQQKKGTVEEMLKIIGWWGPKNAWWAGWCLTYPSEKLECESQLGLTTTIPNQWKNRKSFKPPAR